MLIVRFDVLVLTVIQGPNKGKKFELPDHEPQLIGRSSEAILLDDNAISRRHAELTPDDGVWYLRDLDSQNGTWVNSTRIEGRVRLRSGDQIRTGQTLLVFGHTESKASEAVRVVGKDRVAPKIERTLPSYSLSERRLSDGSLANEDSVILSEPEPRLAAMDHLRIIYRLTSMLTERVMARTQLLEGVMDLVFSEFHPQRGCIMLAESLAAPGPLPDPLEASAALEVAWAAQPGAASSAVGDLRFVPAVVRYREAPLDPEEAKIQVSRTILQHALAKNEGVLSTNAMTDPRFAKGDSVQRLNIRSAICSPIRFRERTYGAIYIDSSMANYTFTAEQLALMNAIGQHAGLALANADLYQQKLQAERLAAIGETVATLSHSIKNILQGLRGGADVVEMGLTKDDLKIAKGGWPILKRNLARIVSLTLNMLAFSRQRRVELEVAPLGPIIEDCVELLEPQVRAKGIAMIVDVDAEVPPVPIDPALVHQALMNLLTNAVEAVPAESGVVTVRVVYRPAGSARHTPAPGQARVTIQHAEVEVAIIDNGPGIPLRKQPWVFEPFHTTKGVKGTGLGLAVARRVALQHAGSLVLDATEGKGATFRMILPAEAHAGDPSATHGERDTGG